MNSRWTRARVWAGLVDVSDVDPAPWGTAMRAWVLVYLPSTLVAGGIFWTAEVLMEFGAHSAAESLAPMLGAAVFMGAIGGGSRPARSPSPSGMRRIPHGTWVTVAAWTVVFVLAGVADSLIHQPAGWLRFVVAVGMATVGCVVFVAVTHVRPRSDVRP